MIVELDQLTKPISFDSIFEKEGPVEIEIGVGKGKFLREYAHAHPETNLLGIERFASYIHHTKVRLEKAAVENVRLIPTFAEPFVTFYLPDESISAYHIYFPDPWPKRRHQKHRLFQPSFIRQLIRTLKPNAPAYISTDHQDYFSSILRELGPFLDRELMLESTEETEWHSNYHVKYLKEGREIHSISVRKNFTDVPKS